MNRSNQWLRHGLLIVAAACSLSALPSCKPQPTPGGETKVGSERDELARRLKLGADRFDVIKVGDVGVVAFSPDKDCSDGFCTCTGDADCNDMFSGVCSDPSTDGICQIRDGVPRCRCKDPVNR